MNYYKLKDNINYVIIENEIVVLDFNDGSFYILDESYIKIFCNENNRILKIDDFNECSALLNNLIHYNFIYKV